SWARLPCRPSSRWSTRSRRRRRGCSRGCRATWKSSASSAWKRSPPGATPRRRRWPTTCAAGSAASRSRRGRLGRGGGSGERAALVGLTAAALLAAAVGLAWHSRQVAEERDRADRSAQLALKAVNDLLTDAAEEELAVEPRMEEKRRRLLEKALVIFQRLRQD